ncbi:MAG TPA: prenyltransferase/squalene oxidase repeat-containing protein [Acidimicrobiales bacterium]|nr:prenyltransferase/squalene oxidase repeat-containing protein [Acidimicrobiales bacterium]
MTELARTLPAGPGREALEETAATIGRAQQPDGLIPWFRGGHADPWNHVEAAMALSATGELDAAERAYGWLARNQRDDGAWHAYYHPDGSVEEARIDTNATAYVATGAWHHFLSGGDLGFLEALWPVVERAIGFVLAHQRPGGEICWSVEPSGSPAPALLAASSSLYGSLVAAVACARALGRDWPAAERAAERLRSAIGGRPWAFAPKDEFAMDWYYPVLSGAVEGVPAWRRLEAGREAFVVEGRGVRCRSDARWVTTAETAEYALACVRIGRDEEAEVLLGWLADQRQEDGSYTTGLVYPERSEFPPGERTTYSAAAVVLAADALAGGLATASVFGGSEVRGSAGRARARSRAAGRR